MFGRVGRLCTVLLQPPVLLPPPSEEVDSSLALMRCKAMVC